MMHLHHLGTTIKFCCSRKLALAFAAIHRWLSPLPHYCGISNLPGGASADQTTGWMAQKFQFKEEELLSPSMCCMGEHCHAASSQLTTDHLFGPLEQQSGSHLFHSNEEGDTDVVSVCECQSPMTQFLNSCQSGTNHQHAWTLCYK